MYITYMLRLLLANIHFPLNYFKKYCSTQADIYTVFYFDDKHANFHALTVTGGTLHRCLSLREVGE